MQSYFKIGAGEDPSFAHVAMERTMARSETDWVAQRGSSFVMHLRQDGGSFLKRQL